MQESQAKFRRPLAIVGALVLGGLSFFILQKAYPGGGFIRDLLAVAAFALVGMIISLGMKKGARRGYVLTLCTTAVVLLIGILFIKLSFKTVLEACFSATQLSMNNLDGDPVSVTEHARRYWKNY